MNKLCASGSQSQSHIDIPAAREVWKALDVPDPIGVMEENVGHCRCRESFTLRLEAHLDRFLPGKKDGSSTSFMRSGFTDVYSGKSIP